MSSGTDKLFLLEFVVDSVDIEILPPSTSEEDESCVMFQFLNNPGVDVYEKDFAPKQSNTKGGKSCLFALSPELGELHITEFPVFTSIQKTNKRGRQVDVGTCKILITSLFSEILKKVQDVPDCLPISKSMKNKFTLRNVFNDEVGSITVYLRLSFFGKVIVTQFHIGDKSSYMFKGDDSDTTYRCKKSLEGSQISQLSPSCGDSCSLGRGAASDVEYECPKHVKPPGESPRTPLTPQSGVRTPGFQERSCVPPPYEKSSAANTQNNVQYLSPRNATPPSCQNQATPGTPRSVVCSGTLLQKDNLDRGDDIDKYTQSVLQMLKGNNIVTQHTPCQESNRDNICDSKDPNPGTIETQLTSKTLNISINEQVKYNSYNCNLSQSEISFPEDETNKTVAYSLPKRLPNDIQGKPTDEIVNAEMRASKLLEQTPPRLPLPRSPPRFATRETQYMESDFPASIGVHKPEKTSRKCKSKSKERGRKITTKGKKAGNVVHSDEELVKNKVKTNIKKSAKPGEMKLSELRIGLQHGTGDNELNKKIKHKTKTNRSNSNTRCSRKKSVLKKIYENNKIQNEEVAAHEEIETQLPANLTTHLEEIKSAPSTIEIPTTPQSSMQDSVCFLEIIKKDKPNLSVIMEESVKSDIDEVIPQEEIVTVDNTKSVDPIRPEVEDICEEVDEIQHEIWNSGIKVTMKRKRKQIQESREEEENVDELKEETVKSTPQSTKPSSLLLKTQPHCLIRFQAPKPKVTPKMDMQYIRTSKLNSGALKHRR